MSAPTSRAPLFFEVPVGTPPALCRSCHATIYFVTTKAGKSMPVDVNVDGGQVPGADPGCGVSHFATCPSAALHRKAR